MATGVQSKILKSAITKIIFPFNAMWNCLCWSERCTLTISHLVFFKVIKNKYFPTNRYSFWVSIHSIPFIYMEMEIISIPIKDKPGIRHEREGVNGACSMMQKSAWLLCTGLWKAASFNNVSWTQEVTSMTPCKICCPYHVPPLRFNDNKVIPTEEWGQTSSTTGPNSTS